MMSSEIYHSYLWCDVSLSLRLSERGEGAASGFVWLGGLRSDMSGTKADVLVDQAAKLGVSSLRFDYSGHGASSGNFEDYCISDWLDQSLQIFRAHTVGPQILVGSSMGCWLSLRLVQELIKRGESDRVSGLLLLAPAPDFTSELMYPSFTISQRQELEDRGYISEPSEYSDTPMIITKKLIDDGANNRVLTPDLRVDCPVRILQGMQDPDVPYTHALKLVDCLAHDDVTLTLVKDGDHRLSRESDLLLLRRTMSNMLV